MVKSCNEWDTLKEVFVGNIENANNPDHDKDLHCINYADRDDMLGVKEGLYPKQVIEETKEDLEELVSTLKSFGVRVKDHIHRIINYIFLHQIGVQMDITIIVHEIV